MIARLIETSGSDKVPLSHYVIAVCYEKMITRMTYRVSKSFRDALKNLPPTFEFPERFPLISASNSNDKNFISFLLKVEIRLKLHTPIDKLAKHGNDLYNQETYVDFHSILCELLELLLKSLLELREMHHDSKVFPLTEITAKVDFIAVVGTLLRLLVKSQAIKRCLYSIIGFLPDRAAGVKAKVDNKTDGDDNDDERDDDEEDGLYRDDEEEDDDELEGDDESDSVGQGSALIKLEPKSQACLRSLNLGVVYIDAILVLSSFVKIRNSNSVDVNINIKILLLPCPTKDMPMLPWKTLLQHETYFPGKPSPSAKDIVEFLELRASSTGNQGSSQNTTDNQNSSKKGQKSSKKSQKSNEFPVSTEVSPESVTAGLTGLRRDIHDLNKDIFTTKIDHAVNSLTTLQYGNTTPGTLKYINSIIKKLESAGSLYPDNLEDEMDDILEMLRTLADNTRLERMLRKGSPLDTGVGFKGTLHAEACVAAHCTFTDPEWFSPVSYFIIIFCSDLLILLVVCYTSSRCI
jgi:hypothetical protein